MRLLVLVCPLTQYGGAIFLGEENPWREGSCCHTASPHITTNLTWGVIFESSKLKARTSLLPRLSEKRRSSFELWALKQHSKMSPQVGSVVHQERSQVVCGNKEVRKRLTDSNSTPEMDIGLGTDHVRRYVLIPKNCREYKGWDSPNTFSYMYREGRSRNWYLDCSGFLY